MKKCALMTTNSNWIRSSGIPDWKSIAKFWLFDFSKTLCDYGVWKENLYILPKFLWFLYTWNYFFSGLPFLSNRARYRDSSDGERDENYISELHHTPLCTHLLLPYPLSEYALALIMCLSPSPMTALVRMNTLNSFHLSGVIAGFFVQPENFSLYLNGFQATLTFLENREHCFLRRFGEFWWGIQKFPMPVLKDTTRSCSEMWYHYTECYGNNSKCLQKKMKRVRRKQIDCRKLFFWRVIDIC